MEHNINSALQIGKEKPVEITLAPGELGVILEALVTEADGRVVYHLKKRSDSFVRQMADLLWWAFNGYRSPQTGGGWTVDYTWVVRNYLGNASYFPIVRSDTFAVNAGVGVVTLGTIVGTGITAPNISDYAMQTPIAHGTGTGQLQYSAVSFGAPTAAAAQSEFTFSRSFANSSLGTITVKEIGAYCRAEHYDGTESSFLIMRDAIDIAVLNTQTLTINYLIRATV